MPNISETACETVTKLSGFFCGHPYDTLCNIWRGSDYPIFGEEVGKLKLSPLISPKWRSGGLQIFCAVGAFEYSKIKS